MDKIKKVKNSMYCVGTGEERKKIEFIQIGKEWIQSKTIGGYGLKKGTFLSFINHKWKQALHRRSKVKEFFVYSRDFCALCGVDRKSPIKYAHEFNSAGFYELRKQDELHGKAEINSFFYKPTASFPKFKNAWNIPMSLIRPAELAGFGLTHGMVFFYLINKCLLNRSEIFGYTQAEICKAFGMIKRDVGKILSQLAETEMIQFDKGICRLDTEFISMYFSCVNEFWDVVNAEKVRRSDIQTAINARIPAELLNMVQPFK